LRENNAFGSNFFNCLDNNITSILYKSIKDIESIN